MSTLDWSIVVALNGGIFLYGMARARGTKTSLDWFLAGRTLPWWMIGLSLYATVIDAGDLVADSGGTYTIGIAYLVTNWVGATGGWVLLANWIAVPMYRAGMYTNAEYLEARFGIEVRVASALIQALYRTLVLGIIATTLYLVLAIVGGWGTYAWWGVAAIAVAATAYTVRGGLRSVAVTDALQSAVMLVSSVALFAVIWSAVDGWGGTASMLEEHSPGLADQLLHAGGDDIARQSVRGESARAVERMLLTGGSYDPETDEIVRSTPGWLVALAWLIVGFAYAVVNHTQSMRLFGARSEWDMRMAVVVSGVILLGLNFTNLSIGVMGRALFPDPQAMPLEASLQVRDSIFPLLVQQFTDSGIRGLVVAGIVAACFSTFDSIGSTVPSLLVRDVYARLFVRDRDDRHYVFASRLLTPVVILGSFAFVPMFLQERGMLLVFLDWIGAFVVPLLAVYLLGSMTRVHRSSAMIGLAVGIAYGSLKLAAPVVAVRFGVAILPAVLVNNYSGTVASLLLTALAMAAVTVIRGRESSREPRTLAGRGWLAASQVPVAAADVRGQQRGSRVPVALGLVVVAIGCVLSFGVFW